MSESFKKELCNIYNSSDIDFIMFCKLNKDVFKDYINEIVDVLYILNCSKYHFETSYYFETREYLLDLLVKNHGFYINDNLELDYLNDYEGVSYG